MLRFDSRSQFDGGLIRILGGSGLELIGWEWDQGVIMKPLMVEIKILAAG